MGYTAVRYTGGFTRKVRAGGILKTHSPLIDDFPPRPFKGPGSRTTSPVVVTAVEGHEAFFGLIKKPAFLKKKVNVLISAPESRRIYEGKNRNKYKPEMQGEKGHPHGT
jgi:hypothetical protein